MCAGWVEMTGVGLVSSVAAGYYCSIHRLLLLVGTKHVGEG